MKSGSVPCLLNGSDNTELPLIKAHLIFRDKNTLIKNNSTNSSRSLQHLISLVQNRKRNSKYRCVFVLLIASDGIMSTDCFLQTCLHLTDHFLAQSPPKISDYVNMGLYKSSPQGQSRIAVKLEMLKQKCLKHMSVSLCS